MGVFEACRLTRQEAFEKWETGPGGLDSGEAGKRLVRFGYNKVAGREIKWWHILVRQFASPLVYLLVGAAGLGFWLRNLEDGVMILLIVVLNAGLGFFQEHRSEQILGVLKKYTAHRSKVKRGGEEMVVDSSDVVPGDVLIIEAGDIIGADVRFIKLENLGVDESILTGESATTEKSEKEAESEVIEISQAANLGFSGTTVVRGRAEGIVIATGDKTMWGGIARETVEMKRESGFEKDVAKFSRLVLKLIGVTLIALMGANLWLKGGRVSLSEMALFSVALAVSVIPEALPVVITFSLSRGAMKLAKKRVVVKRLTAVEDLGNIQILCTDKTGTLTENRLTVDEIWGADKKEVVVFGAMVGRGQDAFDIALRNKVEADQGKKWLRPDVISETPFDPERKRASVILKDGKSLGIVVRGAPESIWPLCRGIDEKKMKEMMEWVGEKGREGKRVIAIAHGKGGQEKGLEFKGLVSFVDPIKLTAIAAISQATKLGVEIKILTGDGPEVSETVAREVGLVEGTGKVITGAQLDALSVSEQHTAVQNYAVFARVSPTQKNKIIDLLQEKYRVGFLGEGINDGPALKSADVGLVVAHAADVAREAADIVLLKKDLKEIVDGVEQGRIVSVNTRKYILATMASNFGNFYAVSVSTLLIDFLPMLPLQILLLNMLSDLPMVAVATDNVDKREVAIPRRFDLKGLVMISTLLGIVSTIFDFIFFGMFYKISPGVLQTGWFMGSVATELVFLYSIRTRGFFLRSQPPSKVLSWLTIAAFALAIGLPFTSLGQRYFRFVSLNASQVGLVLGVVACYLIVTEAVKLAYYRKYGPTQG